MYKEKLSCICCDGKNLENLLDLNRQPLANSFHDNKSVLETYPLGVNLCKDCFHVQLTHIVDPDLLFKDYLYVSGTAKTLRENFEWFANFVNEYRGNYTSVLDIACNDGTQLDYFKKLGKDTFGIDPAKNLFKESSTRHKVICDYFDSKLFSQKFDVIVGQNVFAHNENAKKFLDDCAEIMNEDSLLFIQTSQSEMISNNEFDTIYHEHISFFNINSMNELAKRTNLHLIDVIKTPVHGISYLFIFSKRPKNKFLIENLIDVESQKGLTSEYLYTEYRSNVLRIVKEFKEVIDSYRDKGFIIVGYGAAAKGMTFLNFANRKMDFILDDNPLKHDLYTPGTNTIIKPANFLDSIEENKKILFVPLAWNFYKEIRLRIKIHRLNSDDRFLRYFPNVLVES